jgi:medium-chain acyl-[acyl-carrier-protein] hydrolase
MMTENKQYLPILEEKFKVRSYHADLNKYLKPHYLTAFLQEAAWKHANHLDLGYEFMQEQGVAWMLARIYFEMEHYPVWRDEITIRTWPKGTEGLFYVRDMNIYNSANLIIGAATTRWLLVDLKSKRPRIPALHTDILTVNKDKHAVERKPEKLRLTSKTEIDRLIARISDIDLNNHVNSNKYIEWIANNLAEAFQSNHLIRSFQMNFLNEVKLGEEVVIYREIDDSTGTTLFEGLKENGSKTCFQAAVRIK